MDQNNTSEYSQEEIEKLRKELEEERAKSDNFLASWQRNQADFQNYKRRAEQDKEEFGKFANTGLLLSILPFVDDIERALASVPPEMGDASWVEGVRLIKRKFVSSLENQGVKPISAVGERFDPRLHEAVKQDAGEQDRVIGEVQKGYMLFDRVIRPSMVIVGNGN